MENKNQIMLGTYPIGRLIWKMSVPSIIGIMAYNVYNIIDTIFIAKGVGTFAAGGLAISAPIFLFLSALSTTLGSGASSVISRALGENDSDKVCRSVLNTFGVFYLFAILVTILGLRYLEPLLYGMGATKSLMPYAKGYARIILIGSVTSTAFSGLIRAEGSSKFAMYVWVIPMFFNIILDPIFIFLFHMGIEGAAFATVIAQCISVIMSFYYFFFSGKSIIKIKRKYFKPDGEILREIILIGLPSFIQLAGYGAVIIVINQLLKIYGGEIAISTYGIVNKINIFLIIPINGIVQGIQPIIGYNYGARKMCRVREVLKKSSIITAIYAIGVMLLLLALAKYMMYIFTLDKKVINLGGNILKIANSGIVFTGLQSIQTVYFQATGKKMISLFLSLCNYIICFIPITMLCTKLFGLNGVWYSFPFSAIVAFTITTAFSMYYFRKD